MASILPKAKDLAPIKGNKLSKIGEIALSMPDKEKTNNKTITIKEGIDLFVIFTSNRESKLSIIVKATILVKALSL